MGGGSTSVLITGICLQHTLKSWERKMSSSQHSGTGLALTAGLCDSPSRHSLQNSLAGSVFYPSWIPVARPIIKCQSRQIDRRKEMNFNSCAWRSLEMGVKKWWSRHWTVFTLPQVTDVLIFNCRYVPGGPGLKGISISHTKSIRHKKSVV